MHFSCPASPVCMTLSADSAYRANAVDCCALTAALAEGTVKRGTCSAELNNAIEATRHGMLFNGSTMDW
eukprot:3680482-Pyramimonas_sp.AAC.1